MKQTTSDVIDIQEINQDRLLQLVRIGALPLRRLPYFWSALNKLSTTGSLIQIERETLKTILELFLNFVINDPSVYARAMAYIRQNKNSQSFTYATEDNKDMNESIKGHIRAYAKHISDTDWHEQSAEDAKEYGDREGMHMHNTQARKSYSKARKVLDRIRKYYPNKVDAAKKAGEAESKRQGYMPPAPKKKLSPSRLPEENEVMESNIELTEENAQTLLRDAKRLTPQEFRIVHGMSKTQAMMYIRRKNRYATKDDKMAAAELYHRVKEDVDTEELDEAKKGGSYQCQECGRKTSKQTCPKCGSEDLDLAENVEDESIEDILEGVTRKHFQQVADVIKAHPDADKRAELAKHHADIFKKQNPRFDANRFYTAANATVKEETELDEASPKSFPLRGNISRETLKTSYALKMAHKDAAAKSEKTGKPHYVNHPFAGRPSVTTEPHPEHTVSKYVGGKEVESGMAFKKKKMEESVSLEEATKKISSHSGEEGYTTQVRHDADWNEYQVHHYHNGKHLGEGPVSYHGSGKEGRAEAEEAAKHAASTMHVKDGKVVRKNMKEEVEQIDEAGYSAKKAAAGKDIGKKGKYFSKIAKSAGKKYGSKAAGQRVAGAVLAKLRAKKSGK